jgi:preprotein translocase subunit SecD
VAPPSRSVPRPWRALAALGVIALIMLVSITSSNTLTPGKWSKDFRVGLGLDLSSGTQVTLKATTLKGGLPTAADLSTAQTILENRVNGTGNSGAEVSTEGTDLINVSVPGGSSSSVIKLVTTPAVLFFRPVLLAEEYTTPTPSTSASASPKASASPSASAKPSASATSTAKTTAKIDHNAASASPSATASASTTPKASASATPKASASASASSTAATSYYGDKSEVKADVFQQFEKLSCTPTTSQTNVDDSWKTKLGYTSADYDNPDSQVVSCDSSGTKYVLGPATVLGAEVKSAAPELDTSGSSWVVSITLNSKAAAAFGTLTTKQYADYQSYESSENLDDYFLSQTGVVLDGDVIAAPASEAALTTGQFQIQGSFTEQYATFLTNVIKYGSLPLTFSVLDSQSVSPTVGHDSLIAGLIAALIGFVLVIVYSFAYYRGLAIVSVASLLIAAGLAYLAVVLLTKYQNFGLELAGIAGLIVAVGITADSFVVFFERLRDEVRDGKSLRPAVESGWRRARRTILVSDTVSFLAALVLYELAIGEVRGFAYTLGLTTVIDVVVVFLFTKPAVTLLARTKFFGNGHRLSGLSPDRLGAKTPWRSSVRRQPAGRASRAPSSSGSGPASTREA